jgi:hypothetical protein
VSHFNSTSFYVKHFVKYCFSDDNTTDSESEAYCTETEDAKGNKIINGITTTREGKYNDPVSELGKNFRIW